jgi:hypothetical protein
MLATLLALAPLAFAAPAGDAAGPVHADDHASIDFGRGSGDGGGTTSQDDDAKDDDAAAGDDGKKDGKDGKKKGKKKRKNGKKGKYMGWHYQPYVTPGGGVQVAENGTSIVAGADAGVTYWKKKWKGDAYVGGSYLTGGAATGLEAHVGNQFGVRQKMWGLAAGLEGFYDQQSDADGGTILEPGMGVRVPVNLTVGPKKVHVFAGVAPAFLFTEGRKGADAPFGDEFEWSVGVGSNTKFALARVGVTQRTTAAGTYTTPIVSLTWR